MGAVAVRSAPAQKRASWTYGARPDGRGPFPSSIAGSKAKDEVETALNMAVCNGTMSLQEAQQIFSTDWFQYYRDHVLK